MENPTAAAPGLVVAVAASCRARTWAVRARNLTPSKNVGHANVTKRRHNPVVPVVQAEEAVEEVASMALVGRGGAGVISIGVSSSSPTVEKILNEGAQVLSPKH